MEIGGGQTCPLSEKELNFGLTNCTFGCKMTFLSDSWMVMNRAIVLARGKKEGNLYVSENKRDDVAKVVGRSKGSNLRCCKIKHEGSKLG